MTTTTRSSACPSATHFLEDVALMEPFTHVANLPSKNIRGHFIDAIAKNLLQNVPPKFLQKLQEATAILHSASLLFDDIEDGTQMRRGEPAAHVIFGMPLSLNAASAATCAALEVMLKDEDEIQDEESHLEQEQERKFNSKQDGDDDGEEMNPSSKSDEAHDCYSKRQESQIPLSAMSSSFTSRHQYNDNDADEIENNKNNKELEKLLSAALQGRLTRVYIDNMKLLHSGQGKDIYWRDIHQCPTLPEYRLMARQKTGGLFRLVAMWALEIEKHHVELNNSSANYNFTKRNNTLLSLCDDFGLCFQILDDVANLCDEKLHAMKTFADDIDEGKFSYPAIHCILAGQKKSPTPDKRLLHALSRKSTAPSSTTTPGSGTCDPVVSSIFMKKSIAEKEFCLNLMREAESIKASCDEVLSLCESLKEKTNEMISLNVFSPKSSQESSKVPEDQNNDSEQEQHVKNNEKCRMILLTLISKMAERAQKYSQF